MPMVLLGRLSSLSAPPLMVGGEPDPHQRLKLYDGAWLVK
jgi:hypothetical protein